MKKEVILEQPVFNSTGNKVATLSTALRGDGATPVIRTVGESATNIIGYRDDGTAIISTDADEVIENERRAFMAAAIKEQKKLCVENGVDPDLVNIIGLEKKESDKNE